MKTRLLIAVAVLIAGSGLQPEVAQCGSASTPDMWSKFGTVWEGVSVGGHFAAWEQPHIFAAELRAGFGPLRSSE